MNKKSDQQLVKLALCQPQGFRFLMQRYEKPLFYYIRRISGFSIEESQDLLQEVFLKVYKNLNGYDPQLKFSSWIYRITHNEVISKYRKLKARPEQISYDWDEKLLNKLMDDSNFQKDLDLQILSKLMTERMFQLEYKYREILFLRYFDQKDYQEISDILKKPKGTVATLLNRAKKKLKKLVDEKNIKF